MCDMEAGVKILKYLRKTYDLGLYYRSNANSSASIFNSETPEKLKQRLKGFGITLMGGMAPEGPILFLIEKNSIQRQKLTLKKV